MQMRTGTGLLPQFSLHARRYEVEYDAVKSSETQYSDHVAMLVSCVTSSDLNRRFPEKKMMTRR